MRIGLGGDCCVGHGDGGAAKRDGVAVAADFGGGEVVDGQILAGYDRASVACCLRCVAQAALGGEALGGADRDCIVECFFYYCV